MKILEHFVLEALRASKDPPNVQAFMKDLLAASHVNPFDDRFIYWALRADSGVQGVVTMQIYPWEGLVHIASIDSSPKEFRGQGGPKYVMEMITKLADKHGVTLDLDVKPYGDKGLNKSQLTAWYKRLGFVNNKYGNMVRAPLNT